MLSITADTPADTSEQQREVSVSDSVKRLVPIPDARSELGGIGHTTIYDLIARGELIKVNIGRRAFVTSESLAAYVDRLTEAATNDARGIGVA